MEKHTQLIDAIGSKTIRSNGISSKQVYNWRSRGIAWRYRPLIAELASEKGVELPSDFLRPAKKA